MSYHQATTTFPILRNRRKVVEIVNKMSKEVTATVVESVYKHLEAKKPGSFWIVGVVRGSKKKSWWESSVKPLKTFINCNLGNLEDRDLVVYELEHLLDESEAQANVSNENWVNKVKLAYLQAQKEKEKATDIHLRAAELFPELKLYQKIIFQAGDKVWWSWKDHPKNWYFGQVIGDWLVIVIVIPSSKDRFATAESPPDAAAVPAGSYTTFIAIY